MSRRMFFICTPYHGEKNHSLLSLLLKSYLKLPLSLSICCPFVYRLSFVHPSMRPSPQGTGPVRRPAAGGGGHMQEVGQALSGRFGRQSSRSGWDNQRRKDEAWCPLSQRPGPFLPILEPVLPLSHLPFSSIPAPEVRSKSL